MPILRLLLAAGFLALSLTGCDIFDKKKAPLPGERIAVFSDRKDIESDKEAANIQVTLPGPVVNDSWPQSGGFANYAMQHLAIGDSPQVIWTADVGSGSSSSRILTTPPVVADGKVFAKDAESTVSAFNAETGQRAGLDELAPSNPTQTAWIPHGRPTSTLFQSILIDSAAPTPCGWLLGTSNTAIRRFQSVLINSAALPLTQHAAAGWRALGL